MKMPKRSFSMKVDIANPGQFFACCGLLELAHRFWPGAEGWFQKEEFCLASPASGVSITSMADRLRSAELCPDDDDADGKTSPMRLQDADRISSGAKPLSVRLDWWLDKTGVAGSLKTWAGQQKVTVISRAMLHTAVVENSINDAWLDYGRVASDPESPRKPVEPFYFDARRFAHSLDTGFSLDVQEATTMAHPGAEFLCFVGLQRFLPQQSSESKWSFEYWTWPLPLCAPVAAGIACGSVPISGQRGYRFRLRFRDDQKRYKAFGFATQIGGDT